MNWKERANLIKFANPNRNIDNVDRRIIKLFEEYGEIVEAYLGVTSTQNYKNKKDDDLREEIIDLYIVAMDVRFTFNLPEFESSEDENVDFYDLLNKAPKYLAGIIDHDINALDNLINLLIFILSTNIATSSLHLNDEMILAKLAKWNKQQRTRHDDDNSR
ncbi:MAG: MazG-like family protein [Candidimonas sp.]